MYVVYNNILYYTNHMDAKSVFKALDKELKSAKVQRELIICGGAALIALGVVSRQTRDVDVLSPLIDKNLKNIAIKLAPSLGLKENWLNNGPIELTEELPKGWESRSSIVFEGSNLIVKSISRSDLIFSKLYAACDRQDDLGDLVTLKPSDKELKAAEAWVLQRDASDIWPQIVAECLHELYRRLHGKR